MSPGYQQSCDREKRSDAFQPAHIAPSDVARLLGVADSISQTAHYTSNPESGSPESTSGQSCFDLPNIQPISDECPQVGLLASVSCPVRLKAMARFREFLRDFAAGGSRGKKFLMIRAYQPTESFSQAEQHSGQLTAVLFKFTSDYAIFCCNIHCDPFLVFAISRHPTGCAQAVIVFWFSGFDRTVFERVR